MIKTRVLHLTHTDLRYDSRILKELSVLKLNKKLLIKAIGIRGVDLLNNKSTPIEKEYTNFILYSKLFKILSRRLSSFLCLFEFYLRLTLIGILFRPRIIHCHDNLVLSVGVILSKFCKSKLIYDAHELESQKNGQSKLLSRVTLLIEKMSWRYIDVLISVSPSIIDWYQKHLGVKESLLILNSPQTNTEIYDSTYNNYLRIKYNIPKHSKIFIYIGILGRGRGIDLYLNVFQSPETNSHLVFIGYGEDLKKIHETSLNSNNIHYHPPVKHDEVLKIARSADVGLVMIEPVSLSDYFCLPNKLFESAFSGLYILASDFPDIKKVIEDFELGMVCSFDYESLKKAVKELDHLSPERSTKDLYELSWDRQSDKLINLYKDIIVH
jgi:glycosyltransferase involved in cell wall biosynthesis